MLKSMKRTNMGYCRTDFGSLDNLSQNIITQMKVTFGNEHDVVFGIASKLFNMGLGY